MLNHLLRKLDDTLAYLRQKVSINPKVGLILGSGLGQLAEEISSPQIVSYSELPHFPVSTVEGHKGQLVVGELAGKQVVTMQGRFHYYEGYSLEEVTYPVRVMKQMGVETLIVTNAAGGVNRQFRAGDLMLITDHINLIGANPLRGPNADRLGPRFPDMSEAYNKELRQQCLAVAREEGIQLRQGVYAGLSGPSYETPAEIKFLHIIGADAVGMSTVPEVIVANHSNMRVLGISCITNMAAGVLPQKLSHHEVMETAERVKATFTRLIKGVLAAI